ncbi:MAG: hypothetical protein U0414_05125 [Polyangiaceae bacterium]
MTRPLHSLIPVRKHIGLVAGVALLVGCASHRASPTDPAPQADALGTWSFMRFRGGPPEPGQITDRLEIDFDARRVHLVRERALARVPEECTATLPADGALGALANELRVDAMRSALEHPDRIPSLRVDMGYFEAKRGAVTLAVSDAMGPDDGEEAAALRDVASAFAGVLTEVLEAPECDRVAR